MAQNILSAVREFILSSGGTMFPIRDSEVYTAKFKECNIYEVDGVIYFGSDSSIIDSNNFSLPVAALNDARLLLASGNTRADINLTGGVLKNADSDYLYTFKHPIGKYIFGRSTTKDGETVAKEIIMPFGMVRAIRELHKATQEWKENY